MEALRLPRPHPPSHRVPPARPGRLIRGAGLGGVCALALPTGCVGGAVRTGSAQGPFGPPLPPGREAAPGISPDFALAGLALGLALGFALGLAWPAWRRRAGRAAQCAAKGLPGDLTRLRAALCLLEDLLLDWRGRPDAARGAEDAAKDGGQSRAPRQDKPGGRCRL